MLQTPSLDVLEYGWKLGDQDYAPVPSTDPIAKDYLLKFVSCNCEGTVAHLGAVVKSKESSIFLLAAHVMVTLARISTKQLMRAVREMSGSRVKYQGFNIEIHFCWIIMGHNGSKRSGNDYFQLHTYVAVFCTLFLEWV